MTREATGAPAGTGAPRTWSPAGIHAFVAEAWADELRLEHIDPDAGFFDLGATSAVVLAVVARLRAEWPGLKLVHVFEHPTVSALARHVATLPPRSSEKAA